MFTIVNVHFRLPSLNTDRESITERRDADTSAIP